MAPQNKIGIDDLRKDTYGMTDHQVGEYVKLILIEDSIGYISQGTLDNCGFSAIICDRLTKDGDNFKTKYYRGKTDSKLLSKDINPEYRKCSNLLADGILAFTQRKIDSKTLSLWDSEVESMVKFDIRSIDSIIAIISELNSMAVDSNKFCWRKVILSMGKLRERWNEGKIHIGMTAFQEFNQIGSKYDQCEVLHA